MAQKMETIIDLIKKKSNLLYRYCMKKSKIEEALLKPGEGEEIICLLKIEAVYRILCTCLMYRQEKRAVLYFLAFSKMVEYYDKSFPDNKAQKT